MALIRLDALCECEGCQKHGNLLIMPRAANSAYLKLSNDAPFGA